MDPTLTTTHEVFNQVPPLADTNLYAMNSALREAVFREGADSAQDWLMARIAELASAAMIEHGGIPARAWPQRGCYP